jgi:hypothetical protein
MVMNFLIPPAPAVMYEDGQGIPDTALFFPSVQGSGSHAGVGPPPTLSSPNSGPISCYAEPATNEAMREDGASHVPLGKKTWSFFTPVSPGIGTDGFVYRRGQWFAIKAAPVPCGGGWRTEAKQIT